MDMDLNFAKSLINNLSLKLNIVLDPTPFDYTQVQNILRHFPETDETLQMLCSLIQIKRDNRRIPGFTVKGWTVLHDQLYYAISNIKILYPDINPGQGGGGCGCGGRI